MIKFVSISGGKLQNDIATAPHIYDVPEEANGFVIKSLNLVNTSNAPRVITIYVLRFSEVNPFPITPTFTLLPGRMEEVILEPYPLGNGDAVLGVADVVDLVTYSGSGVLDQ